MSADDADARGARAWLARARCTAAAPPRTPRAPLHLATDAGSVAIGSIDPHIAERLLAARLPIARTGDDWQIAAPASPSLARIARWLADAGLTGRWRDELLAVVDDAERPVAAVERSVVRVLGLVTFAVHLVGVGADGRIWIQQRAFDKATDPGLWDTLMGGQIGAGESVETALARETAEEAGLDLGELREIRRGDRLTIRRPLDEGYMVEHLEVYSAHLPEGVVPCNRDGEVERFECVAPAELEERLARGDFTLEASLILAPFAAPG